MTATAQAEPDRAVGPVRAPPATALWAIALAGVAGSAISATVAMTTERTTEPGWQADRAGALLSLSGTPRSG